MKGTFYINSGAVDGQEEGSMTWTQIQAMRADGNDIGGHTLNHVDISTADTSFDYRWHQTCDDRARLQAQGFSPSAFAYPFAAFNAQATSIVQGCGYQIGPDRRQPAGRRTALQRGHPAAGAVQLQGARYPVRRADHPAEPAGRRQRAC